MHFTSHFYRGAFRFALFCSALITLPVLGCAEGGTERFEPIAEATPIPRQTPEELGIEPFIGEAVVPRRQHE